MYRYLCYASQYVITVSLLLISMDGAEKLLHAGANIGDVIGSNAEVAGTNGTTVLHQRLHRYQLTKSNIQVSAIQGK